jgi:hypothetical protein
MPFKKCDLEVILWGCTIARVTIFPSPTFCSQNFHPRWTLPLARQPSKLQGNARCTFENKIVLISLVVAGSALNLSLSCTFSLPERQKRRRMENLHYCESYTTGSMRMLISSQPPCPVGGQSQFIQPMLLGKESPVQNGYEFVPPYNNRE